MYKEIIISVVIIAVVIIVNFISQIYTDKIIEEKKEELNSIKQATNENVENDNNRGEELKQDSEKILNSWKDQYNLLAVYLEHDELEKVEKELVSLKANAETKDYEDLLESVDMCLFTLEHLQDREVLNLDNFF